MPNGKIFVTSHPLATPLNFEAWCRSAGRQLVGPGSEAEAAWAEWWLDGDLERIYADPRFVSASVLVGLPWSAPHFYKILFHRFPDARFIHFRRDADDWFDAYLKANMGRSDGKTKVHAKVFNRMLDYVWMVNNIPEFDLEGSRQFAVYDMAPHYKAAYEAQTAAVRHFFTGREARLLIGAYGDADVASLGGWLEGA